MLNSPQRRWDCIRKSSNTRGVNCKVCWTQWGFQTINRHVYVYVYKFMLCLLTYYKNCPIPAKPTPTLSSYSWPIYLHMSRKLRTTEDNAFASTQVLYSACRKIQCNLHHINSPVAENSKRVLVPIIRYWTCHSYSVFLLKVICCFYTRISNLLFI